MCLQCVYNKYFIVMAFVLCYTIHWKDGVVSAVLLLYVNMNFMVVV